jgi:ribosomal subunit interface protein
MRISGKNLDIGQALRRRIDETVSALVAKYLDMGYSGQVTVSKSGRVFETECALHLDSGLVVEARGADADAQLSFAQAAEHLDTQLRRYKRRLKNH